MITVILFSLIGGLLSLSGALLFLKDNKTSSSLAKYGVPFAAGVLLATAFVDLLPEALEDSDNPRFVLLAALSGLLTFFVIERYVRWFHHHHEDDVKHSAPVALIIIGDLLHNAIDGVAIGAAFLIGTPTGIVTAVAVALHEIPQEIGDFSIMLRAGMSRRKVIMINVFSALATTLKAIVTYIIGGHESVPIAPLLAITAGFFIYIAASDIIPELHDDLKPGVKDIRPWLLIVGAILVSILSPLLHGYVDSGHDHEHESHENSSHADDHTDEEMHSDE